MKRYNLSLVAKFACLFFAILPLVGAKKQQDPFVHPFANPAHNPELPQVLIIGDSISIAYTPAVRTLLKGDAQVHRPPTNCKWSAFGDQEIDKWLGSKKWDVIHFNFGLWDWYGWGQKQKATPKSYAQNLQRIVKKLRKTGARLIFGSTTPPCFKKEKSSKVLVSIETAQSFNQLAKEVMEKNGVTLNDLFATIGDNRSSYQRAGNDVHYTKDGTTVLATAVALAIRDALPKDKQNLAKKSVLFIAGNTKHRHGFHEYKAGSILLADALNASGLPIEAKVHWYGWPKDESIFDGVDACIIYADGGGEFGEKYAFLQQKVNGGMGIMFMHYGVHPTKEVGEKYYNQWIGGFYDDEFSVNPSWIAEMTPKAGHPVSRGLSKPIRAYDEFYYNLNLDKSCNHCYPLATAIPTKQNVIRYGSSKFWNRQAEELLGTPQALLWCKDPKEGARGAGFVGGHYHRNWAIDDYRTLILNTIAWVAQVKVPPGGVPSDSISLKKLNENLNRPDNPEIVVLPTSDLLEQEPATLPLLRPDGRMAPRKKKR
ncbi:MAG: SGNH/GDSL hydrolase family protein [Opitutae bacterium]|jgi:hypothetical protein|nr:SGNH/GDSL hydrolase family protein [Opitutae bacterium]